MRKRGLLIGTAIAGVAALSLSAIFGGDPFGSCAAAQELNRQVGFVSNAPLDPPVELVETPIQHPIDADFSQHVAALRRSVPKGFSIVVQKPFVVIGNQSPDAVRRRARGTVKWAVDALKQDFFPIDPDHIIDIWLFGDAASYRRHVKETFGYWPDTPYGFYSASARALIMNIATGGGTLVHEIVHPFVDANFPDCPPWLNEGLGSLYEHSTACSGRIWGLTNWRLTGLQRSIRRREVLPFKILTGLSRDRFYGQDSGTHYAQSRYLLQYLQEKGLLRKFYHAFYKNRLNDSTGFETLRSVLQVEEMVAFERRWQQWVLSLRLD